jgi:hypothetical protein
MHTSSEDMLISQSQGYDMSVDSMALEEYDYYENVQLARWIIPYIYILVIIILLLKLFIFITYGQSMQLVSISQPILLVYW